MNVIVNIYLGNGGGGALTETAGVFSCLRMRPWIIFVTREEKKRWRRQAEWRRKKQKNTQDTQLVTELDAGREGGGGSPQPPGPPPRVCLRAPARGERREDLNSRVMAPLYCCEINNDICWFIHSTHRPLAPLSSSLLLSLSLGVTACDLRLQHPE